MADVVTVDVSGGALFKTLPSVAASAGAGDAGKIVQLAGAGVLDQTMFPSTIWFDYIGIGGSPGSPVGLITSTFGALVASTNFVTGGNLVVLGGTVDFSAVTTITLQANSIAWAALPPVNGYSILCNSGSSPAPTSWITAGAANTVPLYSGSSLAFAKVPVGALADAGRGVWGRTTNSSGAQSHMAASANGQALRVDAAGTLGFGQLVTASYADASVTHAKLSNAGMSVLARTANSSGARTDLAPNTPGGGGDVLFVENASLVFDNWVRQRRNIMRGFWEFEGGALGFTNSGDPIRGTPFIGTRAGAGLVVGSDRSSAYTRNNITLATYNLGDAAAFSMGDVVASGVGIPIGAGPLIFEASANISALGVFGNDYTLNIGLLCDDGTADDGVFFQYQRLSSANWRLVARNGGTTTVTTSGAAVSATSARLRIEVASSGLATFYINGTSVGTVTSNIPARVGIGVSMGRDSGATTQLRYVDIDYVAYQLALATPRSATQR